MWQVMWFCHLSSKWHVTVRQSCPICHSPDPYPDYLGFSYDADYPSYFFEDWFSFISLVHSLFLPLVLHFHSSSHFLFLYLISSALISSLRSSLDNSASSLSHYSAWHMYYYCYLWLWLIPRTAVLGSLILLPSYSCDCDWSLGSLS